MVNHGQDYKILRKLKLLAETDTEIGRQDNFTLLRDSIQAKIREAYNRNVKSYNLRSRRRDFEVGQVVIRRNFAQSSLAHKFNAKLAPTGVKAVVKRKVGNVNYELEDLHSGQVRMYHVKDIWT